MPDLPAGVIANLAAKRTRKDFWAAWVSQYPAALLSPTKSRVGFGLLVSPSLLAPDLKLHFSPKFVDLKRCFLKFVDGWISLSLPEMSGALLSVAEVPAADQSHSADKGFSASASAAAVVLHLAASHFFT